MRSKKEGSRLGDEHSNVFDSEQSEKKLLVLRTLAHGEVDLKGFTTIEYFSVDLFLTIILYLSDSNEEQL